MRKGFHAKVQAQSEKEVALKYSHASSSLTLLVSVRRAQEVPAVLVLVLVFLHAAHGACRFLCTCLFVCVRGTDPCCQLLCSDVGSHLYAAQAGPPLQSPFLQRPERPSSVTAKLAASDANRPK
eukprot:2669694-Amphidinium_carterae.1